MNRYELLRYEKGLTREEVAALSGISTRTIARLESEEIKPNAATAKALAEAYGLTVADLLGLAKEAA